MPTCGYPNISTFQRWGSCRFSHSIIGAKKEREHSLVGLVVRFLVGSLDRCMRSYVPPAPWLWRLKDKTRVKDSCVRGQMTKEVCVCVCVCWCVGVCVCVSCVGIVCVRWTGHYPQMPRLKHFIQRGAETPQTSHAFSDPQATAPVDTKLFFVGLGGGCSSSESTLPASSTLQEGTGLGRPYS